MLFLIYFSLAFFPSFIYSLFSHSIKIIRAFQCPLYLPIPSMNKFRLPTFIHSFIHSVSQSVIHQFHSLLVYSYTTHAHTHNTHTTHTHTHNTKSCTSRYCACAPVLWRRCSLLVSFLPSFFPFSYFVFFFLGSFIWNTDKRLTISPIFFFYPRFNNTITALYAAFWREKLFRNPLEIRKARYSCKI